MSTTSALNLDQNPRPDRRPRAAGLRRLRRGERIVLGLAALPLAVVLAAAPVAAVGLVDSHDYWELALALAENPGLLVLAAIFAITPITTLTGRRHVTLRMYLGILLAGYATVNTVAFLAEDDAGRIVGDPFLLAGAVAAALILPLAATSNRTAQRWLGARNWRSLHRLTYVIVAAMTLHLFLLPGEPAEGLEAVVLFGPSVALRLPPIRDRVLARRARAGGGSLLRRPTLRHIGPGTPGVQQPNR